MGSEPVGVGTLVQAGHDVTTVDDRVQAETQLARDALREILPHVTAMNSFLRSPAAARRGHASSLDHVVYHYKREALIQASRLGIAKHRRANVLATCRDCGGSGRYADWSGYEHDHCYHCGSSGVAHLEFVETDLPGVTWLTPRQKAYEFIGRFEELEPTANNIQINQLGRDLTPSEVADHLNAIEAFFTKRPPEQWSDDTRFDVACTYSIWIGETASDRCHLCRIELNRDYGGHIVRTGRVMWNARVCKSCGDRSDVFTTLSPTLPQELITPEIAAWMAQHPAQNTRSKVVAVEYAVDGHDAAPF